jgi:hypothetical protein
MDRQFQASRLRTAKSSNGATTAQSSIEANVVGSAGQRAPVNGMAERERIACGRRGGKLRRRPLIVKRSGRVWSTVSFITCGSTEATTEM